MHSQGSGIDEALWAAYHRDDKAAVTDYLFRRSLVGGALSRSFPRLAIKHRFKKGCAARRAHGKPMLLNHRARQIPVASILN